MNDDSEDFKNGMLDVSNLSGIQRLQLGWVGVARSSNDPEDTLLISLTRKELSLLVLGSMLVLTIFPEFAPFAHRIHDKIAELGGAQGFMDPNIISPEEL